MKHKYLHPLLSLVILAGACGKKENSGAPATVQRSPVTFENPLQDFSNQGSLDLAQVLAGFAVEGNQKAAAAANLRASDTSELTELSTSFRKYQRVKRNEYVLRSKELEQNEVLLRATIVGLSADRIKRGNSIEDIMYTRPATVARAKFLKEIQETYHRRTMELAEEVAPLVAAKLEELAPQELASVEMEVRSSYGTKEAKLKKIAKLIKKTDELQHYLNTHTTEEVTERVLKEAHEALYMYIAQKLLEEIERSKTLKELAKIAKDVQYYHDKIKEAYVLVVSIQEYAQFLHDNLDEFKRAKEEITNAASRLTKELASESFRNDVLYPVVIGYAADRILNHSQAGKEIKKAAVKAQAVIRDIDTIVDRTRHLSKTASGLMDDFNVILQTTQAMTKTLGIKLPKGVDKFISDVQRVNQLVQGAKAVAVGFSAGGPAGALLALSSGPAAQILGGGGPSAFESGVMEQFKVINAKLDALLQGQKDIMKLQEDTIKMVYNLAQMVEAQHAETQSMLVDIKYDLSKMNEGIEYLTYLDVKKCSRVLSYGLGSELKRFDFQSDALTPELFAPVAESIWRQRLLVTETPKQLFEGCQAGLESIFGANFSDENNLVMLKYNHLAKVQLTGLEYRDIFYQPLLSVLKNYEPSPSNGLHLPLRRISDVSLKRTSLSSEVDPKAYSWNIYHLINPESLLSTSLELLVLHPYMEFGHDDWSRGINAVLEKASSKMRQEDWRSYQFLQKALHLTQTAIIQQGLLSGESIMDKLEPVISQSFQSKEFANDLKPASARMNPILMRNYMKYMVLAKNEMNPVANLAAYNEAYANKDLPTLGAILFGKNVTPKLEVRDGRFYLLNEFKYNRKGVLSAPQVRDVQLPTPEEMATGEFEYTASMGKLVELQEKLVDGLSKFTSDMDGDDVGRIKDLILLNRI